jgi:hypothetical protein
VDEWPWDETDEQHWRALDEQIGRRIAFSWAIAAVLGSVALLVSDFIWARGVDAVVAALPLAVSVGVWLLLRRRSGLKGQLQWLAAAGCAFALLGAGVCLFFFGGFFVIPIAVALLVSCGIMCPSQQHGSGSTSTT